MAFYRVEIKRSAKKEIRQLPQAIRAAAVEAIYGLVKQPRPSGVKKLTGHDSVYRLRKGDYRVVYEIQDKLLIVTVVKVGHRKDVYG